MAHTPSEVDAWKERAACRGADTNMFFPSGKGVSKAEVDRALEICSRCPVKEECFEYATTGMVTVGVWGETTDKMRRAGVRR